MPGSTGSRRRARRRTRLALAPLGPVVTLRPRSAKGGQHVRDSTSFGLGGLHGARPPTRRRSLLGAADGVRAIPREFARSEPHPGQIVGCGPREVARKRHRSTDVSGQNLRGRLTAKPVRRPRSFARDSRATRNLRPLQKMTLPVQHGPVMREGQDIRVLLWSRAASRAPDELGQN